MEKDEEHEERRKQNRARRIDRLLIVEPQLIGASAIPTRRSSGPVIMSSTPREMPSLNLSALKRGVTASADDHLGQRVGQGPFQPVTIFDAHALLVRRDEQQLSLFFSFPRAPIGGTAHWRWLDLLAFKRVYRGHDQLHSRFLQIGGLRSIAPCVG